MIYYQFFSVSNTTQANKSNDWEGYVCPTCRFIFKLRKSEECAGCSCPACKQLLSIGRLAAVKKDQVNEGKPQFTAQMNQFEKTTKPDEEVKENGKKPASLKLLFVTILIISVLLITFLAKMLLKEPQKNLVEVPINQVEEEKAVKEKSADTKNWYSPKKHSAMVEETLTKAYAKENYIDFATFVYNKEELFPAMRQHYQNVEWRKTPVREINFIKTYKKKKFWVFAEVTFADFSEKIVYLKLVDDEFKINWEATEGVSQMSWTEFKKTKPKKAQLMRVICGKVDYYNFDFNDDKKWESMLVYPPSEELTFYGYVPIHSDIMMKVFPLEELAKKRRVTLKLKYLENASQSDQVVIEEFVTDGWIID